jgi:hypothetical protein
MGIESEIPGVVSTRIFCTYINLTAGLDILVHVGAGYEQVCDSIRRANFVVEEKCEQMLFCRCYGVTRNTCKRCVRCEQNVSQTLKRKGPFGR